MLRNTRKTTCLFAFFAIFSLIVGCKDGPKTTVETPKGPQLTQLFGKWQSVDNPKSKIELTQTRMFSFYDELKLSDESLTIYQECQARCLAIGMKPMPCFVTDGKRAENCFKVLELTDKKLTYAKIGNEEKVMKFQKM